MVRQTRRSTAARGSGSEILGPAAAAKEEGMPCHVRYCSTAVNACHYLTDPAVSPPISRFSMKLNRMTTGTMAIMATVNRYCQSLM